MQKTTERAVAERRTEGAVEHSRRSKRDAREYPRLERPALASPLLAQLLSRRKRNPPQSEPPPCTVLPL